MKGSFNYKLLTKRDCYLVIQKSVTPPSSSQTQQISRNHDIVVESVSKPIEHVADVETALLGGGGDGKFIF